MQLHIMTDLKKPVVTFTAVKVTDKGTEMSVLYSGPLPDAKVVLPLGTFELLAGMVTIKF